MAMSLITLFDCVYHSTTVNKTHHGNNYMHFQNKKVVKKKVSFALNRQLNQ